MKCLSLLLIVGLSAVGCQNAADGVIAQTHGGAGKSLDVVPGDGDSVDVIYSSSVDDNPRVMELSLQVSNGARLISYQPGDALKKAQKDLVVQEKADGTIRLVALSAENTSTIGSGKIASLQLGRRGGASVRVELLTKRPMFAPQETQRGLVVSDPIEF